MSTPVTVGPPSSSSAEPDRQAGGAPLHRRLAGSPALRVCGRRVLIAIPVLWGVTFLTFIVLNALPGDAATALLGVNATPAEVRALTIKLHLNEPFLVRYGNWLGGALHGNLGTSLYNQQPVTSIIAQRLPVTVELVVYAVIITFVVSIPLAVLSARRPRGVVDRTSMVLSMGGLSIAPYVLALLLILVFADDLRILPALGYQSIGAGIGGNIKDLTLAAVTIAIPLAAFYTRFLRADLLEQMQSEDYTVTALAKGLSRWQVLTRHALRNSFIGLLTVIGLNLATLIGTTVIVEEIFGLPGIGYQILQAIDNWDVPLVEGIVLVFGVIVVLVNLATDLLYGVLDPRIRHGRSRS
jgi:peptide/nickel transport system permease protein